MVLSSWKLYPRSSVHVLDLTNGKTVYMFVGNVYPIRATLLERMLRHRLTVPPSYCRDVVVAGSVIQTVQAGLRESYECLASAPLACTARQMVFSSPWLTAKKDSGSPLQTALVCNSNPLIALTIYSKLYGYRLTMFHVQRVDMVINPPWNLPFLGAKGLTSPEQTATGKGISNPLMAVMVCLKPYGIQLTNVSIWKLLLRDVAASFDSAVHRVHAVSFDAAVASIVSAACCAAAGYFVYCCCLLCSCCSSILLPQEDLSRNLELTESTPSLGEDCWDKLQTTKCQIESADYVSAGHVLRPESLIRRRNLGGPSSLFDFEEVMSIPHNNMGPPPAGPPLPNNGPPPVVRPNGPAPRSTEELCQPSINGRGEPIAPILIEATNFGLRHHMIQQFQNTCQFHGLPGDDANRHIDKFLEITQHMKQNGVSDDALRLSLFPYSLTHHAIAWYDRLQRNSIHSFDDMMRTFLSKYFPPSMVTKLRNEITKFEQKPYESLFEAWERYKLSIDRCPNHNMLLVTQIDTFYNGLTLSHRDTINAAAGGTFMQKTPEECYELI
ncbi:reverse transcriptase domain-containing protein [Tanacetum coccineum]